MKRHKATHRRPSKSISAKEWLLTTLIILAGFASFSTQAVITPTRSELAQERLWMKENFLTAKNLPPFSFFYDGQPSSSLLPSWNHSVKKTRIDSNRVQYTLLWTNDILEVKCVAVEYKDYPYVEWTVYFKNVGNANTPIIGHIQGLDTHFSCSGGEDFVLNGNQGDYCSEYSYEPYHTAFGPGKVLNFSPQDYSGKSCDGPQGWPYYNLQMSGGGVILAIGWPALWASSFTRDQGTDLHILAGQKLTHLYLKPGEEIRTPLIGMMFWRGTNVVRSQNIWRHWYLAHEMPAGSKPITQIQVSCSDTNDVADFLATVCKPDICWRDAGGGYTWYPNIGPYKGGDSWLNTGTWEVDPDKYPGGFKAYSDWVHAHGMKFLLWFEPERVGSPDSWLGKNHPEWLLPGPKDTCGEILNEGDTQAFNWLTNHIENLIIANRLDWYREDMNGDGPAQAWRQHDAPDRQGITENFYVQGHLTYWDALLAMNPGLRIDSCASGGRRNDLETMRRAIPLLRSDFQFPSMPNVVNGNQCHTYGLSSWLPYQSTGCYLFDTYSLRSFYLPGFGAVGPRTPENLPAWKQSYRESAIIAPIMLNGDYYPLTPYSLADTDWIAWQFDWPAKSEGAVQVFRRGHCNDRARTFHLNGLDPKASYEITNFDINGTVTMSGRELMDNGFTVTIPSQPGAAIITYHRIK